MEKEAFEMVKLSVLPKFVIVPVLLRLPAPLRRAVEAVLWIVPAFVEAAPIVSVLARSTVPPALTVSVPTLVALLMLTVCAAGMMAVSPAPGTVLVGSPPTSQLVWSLQSPVPSLAYV